MRIATHVRPVTTCNSAPKKHVNAKTAIGFIGLFFGAYVRKQLHKDSSGSLHITPIGMPLNR